MSKTLRFPAAADTLTPEQADQMAATMIELADEVLAAETRLRALILEALHAGDAARAEEIVRRWDMEPPVDLLASLEGR